MVGSIGERVLRATLPYVDAWNCWYAWFGNTPEGFAEQSARVTQFAHDVGRDPTTVARTATVFVSVEGNGSERPHANLAPIVGSQAIAEQLKEFGDAGVDEAILVVNPITEASIRALGPVVAMLG